MIRLFGLLVSPAALALALTDAAVTYISVGLVLRVSGLEAGWPVALLLSAMVAASLYVAGLYADAAIVADDDAVNRAGHTLIAASAAGVLIAGNGGAGPMFLPEPWPELWPELWVAFLLVTRAALSQAAKRSLAPAYAGRSAPALGGASGELALTSRIVFSGAYSPEDTVSSASRGAPPRPLGCSGHADVQHTTTPIVGPAGLHREPVAAPDPRLVPRFGSEALSAAVKRSLDIFLCAVTAVVMFPLIVVVAIAIKYESPGPLVYRQERVGLRGKTFTLLKFRSMRVDAEADGAPVWAAAQDPRVTRVGWLIRKVRIDELPQLYNVLRGDMSFVGPRPERPYFVEQLARSIPRYHDRHLVKPGITGWAQVNCPYAASVEDAREKLAYDLYYLKHHGFLLDMLILLLTVRVIVWPKGAR